MFNQINKRIFVLVFILSSLMTGASTFAPLPASQQAASGIQLAAGDTVPDLTAASTPIRFGVIGDYGDGSQAEADVANLVKSWNPDFIVTTGDNNYPDGAASTIDAHIGQFYHDFIYPYKGTYGSGATTNLFFPTLGNNDWDTLNAKAYFDYFTLPGNERYYDYVWGPVHFFVIDSAVREPDGNTSSSIQATWLHNQLAASTSVWNVVYLHHPPYTSGSVTSNTTLQWPYASWGADVVMAGHSHTYERIFRDGIVYFVNGLGGDSIQSFSSIISGSQAHYNGDFGAMLVDAGTSQITFKFINRGGTLIDSYSLYKPSPFSKGNPSNGALNQSPDLTLSWNTSDNASSYQYCIDTVNDNTCNGSWINNGAATSKALSNLSLNTTYYWQVRAVNDTGTTMANDGTWWSFTVATACYTLTKSANPPGSGVINASPAPNCNGNTQYPSGTVVQLTAADPANQFNSWSGDVVGTTNPINIAMTSNKSVTANFTLLNTAVYIEGVNKGNYYILPDASLKQTYAGVDDGPVKVTSRDGIMPILSSERFIFSYQNSKSYAEMMGYPGDQLATDYWFPWYNNLSYSTQLRVSNMGNNSAEVKVYAGTSLIDTFTLLAGQGTRTLYNLDSGPLHVVSTNGVTPILASERFIQTYLNSASYAEMMGYPGDQLTTEYWFPWYNNISYSTQLRVSNMGSNSAEVKVYAGTSLIDTLTLSAGQGARKSYNIDSGPLRVVSTDGVTPILASERFIQTFGTSASYAEMMGYPDDQLTSEYCFPWYNNTTDGALALSSQLRVSNMGTTGVSVKVTLAGSQIDSFSLAGGEGKRVSYPSLNSGPLCVVRTSGTATILASERFISTYLNSASYSEMMGYPANRLAPSYWFPWYNNLSYSTELRIARP